MRGGKEGKSSECFGKKEDGTLGGGVGHDEKRRKGDQSREETGVIGIFPKSKQGKKR